MNLSTSLVSLSAAALIWAGPAQGTLQPVPTQPGQLTQIQGFDGVAWAAAMGETDLVKRKASYEELLALAQTNGAALETIKAWAADASRVELAWTAQLMLRELEHHVRVQPSPFGNLHSGPNGLHDLDSLFEAFSGRPGGRLFGFGDAQLFGGVDPFGGLDLDKMLQGGLSSRSGVQVFQDADGIRVEVTETEDGKTQTKKYEARDLQELLESYPELEDRLGSGRSLPGFQFDHGRMDPQAPQLDSFWKPQAGGGGLQLIEPSLDRLGVQMLTPDRRSLQYPGASAEVGLQVVAVLPGSLAELVGIRQGDLVISIDGHEIRGAQDVRKALAGTNATRKIDIRVMDDTGATHTRSWLPRQPL